jgi:predicted esterase
VARRTDGLPPRPKGVEPREREKREVYKQPKDEKSAAGSDASTGRIAGLQKGKGRAAAFVEKLHGYETPAEYLTIDSVHCRRPMVAAVSLPLDYDRHPKKRYPLVIAFSGASECARSPRDGCLAWIDYYKADEAVKTLEDSHLERKDFRGLVTAEQLRLFNQRLKRHPYKGIILVCPYSPPTTLTSPESSAYEAFVMKELIPTLKKRYRVTFVGVDGVSMGGARALYYGFKYPGVFSSIGAVQGAFGPFLEIYRSLVKRNRKTLTHRSIQLVTSDRDVMASSVERMHKILKAAGIPHYYSVLTGPHAYVFNQGPGSLALLEFHNRVLSVRDRGPVR